MAASGLLLSLVLVHASASAPDLHRAQPVPANVRVIAAGNPQPEILMSGSGCQRNILMSGS